MTTWLQRREKIQLHGIFIHQRQHAESLGRPQASDNSDNSDARHIPEPPRVHTQSIKMTLNPTKSATFDILAHDYGAIDFQDALADFLARVNNPTVSTMTMRQRAENTLIPFRSVSVYHNIKFTRSGPTGPQISDVAHVRPEALNSHS